MTDGKQTTDRGSYTPLEVVSSRLMNKGAAVFALGIGPNVEVSELGKIASNPENVVTIDSFEDLTDKVKDFRDGFCKGTFHTCVLFVSICSWHLTCCTDRQTDRQTDIYIYTG